MANYCPACGGEQRCVVLSAVGYAKSQTDFYERRKASRRLANSFPVWRIQREDPPGSLNYVYACNACDFRVAPGVSHVRNWLKPDHWVTPPSKPRAASEPKRRKRRKKRKVK